MKMMPQVFSSVCLYCVWRDTCAVQTTRDHTDVGYAFLHLFGLCVYSLCNVLMGVEINVMSSDVNSSILKKNYFNLLYKYWKILGNKLKFCIHPMSFFFYAFAKI